MVNDNRTRLSVITFVRFAKIYKRILLYICGICELELLGRMPQTFPPELIYFVNSAAFQKVLGTHLLPYLCEHLHTEWQFLTSQCNDPLSLYLIRTFSIIHHIIPQLLRGSG